MLHGYRGPRVKRGLGLEVRPAVPQDKLDQDSEGNEVELDGLIGSASSVEQGGGESTSRLEKLLLLKEDKNRLQYDS